VNRAQELIAKVLKRTFKPKVSVSPATWVERNIRLSPKTSNISGQYSLLHTPYLKRIYEDFGNPRIRKIVLKKSAQVGATQLASNLLLYYVCNEVFPLLMILPTKELAQQFSERSLHPSITACEAIKPFLTDNQDDLKKTEFLFHSCIARVIGAGMGGRGTENNQILPGVFEDERDISQELQARLKQHRDNFKADAAWHNEHKKLIEEVNSFPPKGRNVFALNAVRWRKRGWLADAYPGIGKGSVVPSDWMPMGNNLFSKRALNLADFTGYVGGGTQDLYLTFRRLKQHGIKICVIPHSVSSHVCRKEDGFKILMLRHQLEGEYEGHLVQEELPWFSHEPGERIQEKTVEDYSI
jgi:hypothetical protein